MTSKNKKAIFTAKDDFTTGENFAELLTEAQYSIRKMEGYTAPGVITDILDDFAIVNVGLKSEAHIPLKEFRNENIAAGDTTSIFIERYESADGTIVASREKARKEEVWKDIEAHLSTSKIIKGEIIERVRGGFTVDLNGLTAFMPSSQLDVAPVKDIGAVMHQPMDFKIIKLDKARGNMIVSHRSVLEGDRESKRAELLASIKVGDVMEGTIKNITDYGVFIDLGGVDGLLHITDISWKRVGNPNEIFIIGQKLKVKIINFGHDTGRISLGMKQLESDPWTEEIKFHSGETVTGRVTNLTDYGAFVDLGGGIEGLIHVSELSWTKKNVAPSKLLSIGEEVSVMILEIDRDKRRISLGLKQTQSNPWVAFADSHFVGEVIEGEIKNITEFGVFIAITPDIDGMAHMSDLSWNKPSEEAVKDFSRGKSVKAKILEIDPEKERVSLGIKQLERDVVAESFGSVRKGEIATAHVTETSPDGLYVDVNGMKGFIKTSEISRNRSEQKPERFAVGEKVDAKIIGIDSVSRRLTLSIKAHEIDEERKIVKEYGSADSGALLGDILGGAIERAKFKK